MATLAVNPEWAVIQKGLTSIVGLVPAVAAAILDPKRPGQIDSIAQRWTRHRSRWDDIKSAWMSDGVINSEALRELRSEAAEIEGTEIAIHLPRWEWLMRRGETQLAAREGVTLP